jgi:glyoxylase-like metal-dependent hydrolase (beta-lactamase superfamily II)
MWKDSNIHRIDTDFYGRTNALYLINGELESILIDTGVGSTPGEYLAPYLNDHALESPIGLVINTHADLDHVGGNGAVAEMFPASRQMCHRLDREWIDNFDALIDERYDEYAELGIAESDETKDFLRSIVKSKQTDVVIDGGEKLQPSEGWNIEVLHAPGHSHGHLSLWDERSRALIIGDAVLSDGLYMTDGSPAFPPTYRYVKDYVDTIDAFLGLKPEVLLTSHYPTMTGEQVMDFLTGSRAYVDRVESVLLTALAAADGPQSLTAIISTVSPELGPWDSAAAMSLKFPLLGHLEAMEDRGHVVRVMVDGVPSFVEAARV